jgi:hypothetical protein
LNLFYTFYFWVKSKVEEYKEQQQQQQSSRKRCGSFWAVRVQDKFFCCPRPKQIARKRIFTFAPSPYRLILFRFLLPYLHLFRYGQSLWVGVVLNSFEGG